jgi:hypothetical protein
MRPSMNPTRWLVVLAAQPNEFADGQTARWLVLLAALASCGGSARGGGPRPHDGGVGTDDADIGAADADTGSDTTPDPACAGKACGSSCRTGEFPALCDRDGRCLIGISTDSACGSERVPTVHRSAGSTCSATRGPGSICSGGPNAGPIQCSKDTDCTAGMNGRCSSPFGPLPDCTPSCSYDECQSDVPPTCRANAEIHRGASQQITAWRAAIAPSIPTAALEATARRVPTRETVRARFTSATRRKTPAPTTPIVLRFRAWTRHATTTCRPDTSRAAFAVS